MMYYDTGKLYYVDTMHSDMFIGKLYFDLH